MRRSEEKKKGPTIQVDPYTFVLNTHKKHDISGKIIGKITKNKTIYTCSCHNI